MTTPKATRMRGPISRGLKAEDDLPPIERDGGRYKAGILRGVAVITRGEALGHEAWIDQTFVDQVKRALSAKRTEGKRLGVKSRYTHPDMSADGLGRKLGRSLPAGSDNPDIARADLHFYASSHNTPDGDLAGHVMALAEEDPESFGTSIVFWHDYGEERKFRENHRDQHGVFRSPDPLNTRNLPHVRLAELAAVDVVDDPAANPGGLFHRDPTFQDAEALAQYAAGLQDEAPELSRLDLNPDKVRAFLTRFLATHKLELRPKMPHESKNTDKTSDTNPTQQDATPAQQPAQQDATPAADPRDAFRAELQRYTDKFGAENGTKWFTEGLSYEQAMEKHCEALAQQNEQLGRKLATAATEEPEPLSGADGEPDNKPTFEGLFRLRGGEPAKN